MNISVNGHTLERVKYARNWHQRLIGLLATNESSFTGLVIDPCNSIHTIGMRYPIDVIFVNDAHVIVNFYENVRPFNFCFGGKKVAYTIELPAGSIEKYNISAGNSFQLKI